MKPLPQILSVALLAIASGCTLVSTGARSAVVVLVRNETTTPGSRPLPMPPRDEIKAALSQRYLWLADDKRAAQWVAYIDVRTPPTPLQPFGLTVVEVRKNPDWDPEAVSGSGGAAPSAEAHGLLDQSEAAERMRSSRSR
jgi:hypothetical protein